MKIKILKGYHLTATERKAIVFMLENGYKTALNRPKTKTYEIVAERNEGAEIDLKAGSLEPQWIGKPKRIYHYFTLQISK